MNQQYQKIGFIGLGVMGEPICRNLVLKSRIHVAGFDSDPTPLLRLAAHGVKAGDSVAAVVQNADLVFLSLPSGEVVYAVAHDENGILANIKPGQIVIDLSTSAVDTTRTLARQFAEHGAIFIDAPVARTRAAAEAGTLSVMVGADPSVFEQVRPLIAHFATEITRCGSSGCGQAAKILNNMVLFQIGVAIAEAKAIAESAGIDSALLFETIAKGSGDSFALRNHGMKAMVPCDFPLRAFSVRYARKDLGYALKLAKEGNVHAHGACNVDALFSKAIESGLGDQYWPVVSRVV